MTLLITAAVLIALFLLTARLLAATPLVRTIGITIDHWADGVQGDGERLH